MTIELKTLFFSDIDSEKCTSPELPRALRQIEPRRNVMVGLCGSRVFNLSVYPSHVSGEGLDNQSRGNGYLVAYFSGKRP